MKQLWKEKGIWGAAAGLIFLFAVFGKTYQAVAVQIPSPDYDNVRLLYLWILAGGCGFLGILAVLLWKKKEGPRFLYPVVLLVLGMMYMAVLPPFSAPDEARHFISAYRLSSQLMGKQAVADEAYYESASEEQKEMIEEGANVLVRSRDDRKPPYTQVGREAYAYVLGGYQSDDVETAGVSVREEVPVKTTPVVFVPQALGITLARLFQMDYVPLIYMGRIFNLLAFVGMCVMAVHIMPFKKEMMMAVSMLPMMLHLAASYSYDVCLTGLSMIFLAYCLHLAFKKERIGKRDVVLLALILILLEPVKVVYLPIVGICLFLPVSKFRSTKEYMISALSVVLVAGLAVYVINKVALASYLTDTVNYVRWDEANGYVMQDVIHQPYEIFRVYYETLLTQFDYYQATMLGAYLGNLDPDLSVPYVCLFVLWVVLFFCSVKREGEEAPLKGGHKVWIAVLLFLSVCMILASMLLGWTPRSFTYITGVQGRYFLPILPLVLLLIFDDCLVLKKDFTKGAFYTECFISVYALIRICSAAVLH